MTCEKCGRDFPSQYYLDFKAVPGMQICTECVGALSRQELEQLRERARIPKRPAGLRPNEFVFPEKCCSCLGPAETKMTVSSTQHLGTMMKILSVQVPVCQACSKRGKIPAYFFVGGIALGATIGVLTGGVILGLFGGGVLGAGGGALIGSLAEKMSEPASIDRHGSLSFRNPKYDALFRAANSRF